MKIFSNHFIFIHHNFQSNGGYCSDYLETMDILMRQKMQGWIRPYKFLVPCLSVTVKLFINL